MQASQQTPRWFREDLRRILREWHRGPARPLPLRNTLLVQSRLEEVADPHPLDVWQAGRSLVEDEIEGLLSQGTIRDMDVLVLRFWQGQTAQEVARHKGWTSDGVFQRQGQALQALADVLWNEELALRARRAQRSAERLPRLGAGQLFGIDARLAHLTALLEPLESDIHVVTLEGIGGIGKTTLADAAARRFLGSPRYHDVLWISARREVFTAWDGIQESELPTLTFETLVDGLVEQLGLIGLRHLPPQQKANGLQQVLRERPCLVVVDNLETADDYRTLVPSLQPFAEGATRFLITSRYSLREVSGVYTISLDELAEPDALALLRYEANTRGLHELAQKPDEVLLPVLQVAGGNPLALKLVVGQAYSLSLPQVLENLREARGKRAEELYRYIYWSAWQQLDDDAREVLILMPLFAGQGARLETIEERSEVKGGRLTDALALLATLSLVNVNGDVIDRRYSIHRLTESFLLNEVIRWQGGIRQEPTTS